LPEPGLSVAGAPLIVTDWTANAPLTRTGTIRVLGARCSM
jgi:hypothetical protein